MESKQPIEDGAYEEINVPLESNVDGRSFLECILNKLMKIGIVDGRTLIGQFLCTDRDKNIILGSCQEFIGDPNSENCEEPRMLGLAMVPGRHVKSMSIDLDNTSRELLNINFKSFVGELEGVSNEDIDKDEKETLER